MTTQHHSKIGNTLSLIAIVVSVAAISLSVATRMTSHPATALSSVKTADGKTVSVARGTRIGLVNIQEVQAEAKVTVSLGKQRDAMLKDLQAKTEVQKKALKDDETALKAQAKSLSQEALKQKVIEFQQKVQKFEATTQVKLKSIQFSFANAVQKVQKEHLNVILENIAYDKGFDILTQSSDSIVINKDFDVTKDVITALNKDISDIKMEDPSKFEKDIQKEMMRAQPQE